MMTREFPAALTKRQLESLDSAMERATERQPIRHDVYISHINWLTDIYKANTTFLAAAFEVMTPEQKLETLKRARSQQ